MMKALILISALALAACGQNGSSVMDEIEKAEGVVVSEPPVTLASGVEIAFQRRGPDQTLAKPGPSSVVLVHYEGSLVSTGAVFDSSFERGEPAEFPLNAVVGGFSEAIQQMAPGDEVIATFPAELGYGAAGRPPAIPPNSALRFRIRLLAYQGADGAIVGSP
jgi:FKBP-type peptidyl-prolyl cis-trans isomerase